MVISSDCAWAPPAANTAAVVAIKMRFIAYSLSGSLT